MTDRTVYAIISLISSKIRLKILFFNIFFRNFIVLPTHSVFDLHSCALNSIAKAQCNRIIQMQITTFVESLSFVGRV